MPKLSDLLSTREITANQTNLEKGKVWVVSPTAMATCIRSDNLWCWTSPGCGTLTIEMWGAAGSGSRMCCCGFGLPGNAPGYTKKTLAVFCGSNICGCPGMSCNAHDLCFSGCSLPTYVQWKQARDLCGYTSGCMCAQGGRAGTSICSTGTGPYCCFRAAGFCNSQFTSGAAGCGIICNHCSGGFLACGYGGDINCCGCISYMHWMCDIGNARPCYVHQFIAFAAGIFAEEGGIIASKPEEDPNHSQWSGSGFMEHMHTLHATSRSPTGGIPWMGCWTGSQACGCYENFGCVNQSPHGVGGAAPMPCDGVRDHGKRGGHGAIRLTYRGSGSLNQNCAVLGRGI